MVHVSCSCFGTVALIQTHFIVCHGLDRVTFSGGLVLVPLLTARNLSILLHLAIVRVLGNEKTCQF